MRVLFWVLLLLNLGAVLYFNMNYLSPKSNVNVRADIEPEKMKLLTDSEVKNKPLRQQSRPEESSLSAENNAVACYEWGSFAENELNDVLTVVNAFFIKHSVTQQQPNESTRYWVYKPPLPTAEAAATKVQELKKLGVKDFFIVQEPKMRNAISFGIFKDESLASKLVEDLRLKGVREVVKEARNQGTGSASLMLEGVTPTLYGQLKKNLPDFPRTEIKEVECTPGN